MRFRLLIAVMGSLMAIATIATAEQIGALLTGYEESPSVSTTGRGEFTATIDSDGDTIFYSETFSGLQGTVTQSHIHVGQLGVNGSIVIFLCQTATNPDPTGLAPACPQEGTVEWDDHAGQRHRRSDSHSATCGWGPCRSERRHPGGRGLRECPHECLTGRRDTRPDPRHRQISACPRRTPGTPSGHGGDASSPPGHIRARGGRGSCVLFIRHVQRERAARVAYWPPCVP